MKSKTFALLLLAGAAGTSVPVYAGFNLLTNFSANYETGVSAGEIVAYDKVTDRLFVTSSGIPQTGPDTGVGKFRVNIFDMSNPAATTGTGFIDFSNSFGTHTDMLGLSSVVVDSARGFGVAALIPKNNTTQLGKVGFFNLATGSIIGTVDVGYHPDSVTFSKDGSHLIVVNEGEFNPASVTNAPGSITLFDISGINSGNLGNLLTTTAVTADFSDANLGAGMNLTGIRNSNVALLGTSGTFNSTVPNFSSEADNPAAQRYLAIEPEYASEINGKIYVSLQDNNALAEYDVASGKWTAVQGLGTITQRIDATDTGGTQIVDDVVKAMPMPDTVGTFAKNGKTYIVTANEGDFRVDDRDKSRFGDTSGDDDMDPLLDTNYPGTATGVRSSAELGRLNVSRIDGDTDLDGKIDEIVVPGTRSISIWEKTDGGFDRVYDSGSAIEDLLAAAGLLDDSRSDDKGPEPEGLVLAEIQDHMFAFVSMERTNDIFQFDITDPENAFIVDRIRVNGPTNPEGMFFISAADSPNGLDLLLVGYEGNVDAGISSTQQVAIFAVSVPEPGAAGLLGVVALGAALVRRRRR